MEDFVNQLETPCIVIDERKALKNIVSWQKFADDNGVALRPHVKTHKIPYFAKLQLAYGAQGITCCKVSEAEVMADSGIDDIFIAYPLIGAFRIKRAMVLASKIKRLILAVDSIEGARALNDAAQAGNRVVEVRMEVDTGADRTGVRYENAVETAKAIFALPFLKLTGIYTFKSLYYQGKPTEDKVLAGMEEGALMDSLAKRLAEEGIPIIDISAGSSPTAEVLAKQKKVTEIRPGTYIFKDYMMYKENVAKPNEFAAHIYVTVVSTPKDEYAVIDGGNKAIPVDQPLNKEPYYYPSLAIIDDNPDLVLTRVYEEHGMVYSKCGKTGLKVGQILKLSPIHVCTAINNYNQVYVYDGNSLRIEKVAGRGMLV